MRSFTIAPFLLLCALFCWAAPSGAQTCWGDPQVCFPLGSRSFADAVLRYDTDCDEIAPQWSDPGKALGAPNANVADPSITCGNGTEWVSLGPGGILEVRFEDNQLVNSGDGQPDLYVFEVGEPCRQEGILIAVRPANATTIARLNAHGIADVDHDGYFDVPAYRILQEDSGQAAVDLDGWAAGLELEPLEFDAVRIQDDPTIRDCGSQGGADIDAVGARTSRATPARAASWSSLKMLYR